jgi:hypothetical protein
MRDWRTATARFYIWFNDGWVKLSLRPGQVISFGFGGPTDEGWAREDWKIEYEIGDRGGRLLRTMIDDGADCDGRLTRHDFSTANADPQTYSDRWAIELNNAIEDGRKADQAYRDVVTPDWQEGARSQRDYAAEAAGY